MEIWLSSSTGLNGRRWSVPCLGQITSGKETRYQFYRNLDMPQDPSGHIMRVSTTLGFDPCTVQWLATPSTLSRPLERWNADAIMPCLLRSITTVADDREVVVRRLARQPRRKRHKTCYSATLPTMNKVQLLGNREETVLRFYSFLSLKQWTARAKPCPKTDAWTASFI